MSLKYDKSEVELFPTILSTSACKRAWEARLIASKMMLKCMLFADVSWPANRKMKEFPMISDFERVAFDLALISKSECASLDALIMGAMRSTNS